MRTYGVTIIFVAFLLVYRFFYNPLVEMRFEEKGGYYKSSRGDLIFYRSIAKHENNTPTIVVFPGMGAHSFSSPRLIERLSLKANLIVLERLSYGISYSKHQDIDLKRYSNSVASILDRLKIDSKVDVLGLSLGSAYATDFYRRHSDRIRSLTFVDCALLKHKSASKENLDRILYHWLGSLKISNISSLLSLPQIRASLYFILGKYSWEDLIFYQDKHIYTSVIEGKEFWRILGNVDFYSDYSDLPFLVVSTSLNENLDLDGSDFLIREHKVLSKASLKGQHKVFMMTSHSDLLEDKDSKLSKLYLDFIESN